MPAKNTTITIPAAIWTEITDSDVTNITFQVHTEAMRIAATNGSAPSDLNGSLLYDASEGEINAALADMFPGATGAVRVFAFSTHREGQIAVSHA